MNSLASIRWTLCVAPFLIATGACSKSQDQTIDSSAALSVATPVSTVGSSTNSGEACPATGKWALCSVEKRLKRSGFVAAKVESESPSRAGFSVKPTVYTLGRGRLEIFLYDDPAALEKDIAGIDTLTVAPAGTTAGWPSTPALIRSGNLAAVYMGQTSRQAERLTLALTAGAPSGG